KRLAIITTLWNYRSHAWHMAERFLHGYPREGTWHQPPFEVVSAYVDQQPSGDLSRRRSDEFGFKICSSVAEALRCGEKEVAVEIYDFHALEMMQCMAERRKAGETGVVSVHALRGDAVWDALNAGSWQAGGWSPQLFEACLCRSQTLVQDEISSHRYPTLEQI